MGRTGIMMSVWVTAQGWLAGPTGVSGGGNFRVTPDNRRALRVMPGPCRKLPRTADVG